MQPLAHKDKPGQSRGAQGQQNDQHQRAAQIQPHQRQPARQQERPADAATVILPQMAQCSGVNGMQTPHKICKPTHKITNVQIVPTMSDGMSNA